MADGRVETYLPTQIVEVGTPVSLDFLVGRSTCLTSDVGVLTGT